MSIIDPASPQSDCLHWQVPKAPECTKHKPVASYDQMLAFLKKIRDVFETPSLENMIYILANQEPLHDVRDFIHRLSESLNLAALACNKAQRRSKDVASGFQQAWDFVDVKVNDIATQTRYISNISQELGETWRTHTSPPNKHWRIVCSSLAVELKEAVENRHEMRWDLKVAERRAENWEARHMLAVEQWWITSQDALQLQEALTAMQTEFLAGQSLSQKFVPELQEDTDWNKGNSEMERVRGINRALRPEEERESAKYMAPCFGSRGAPKVLEVTWHQRRG